MASREDHVYRTGKYSVGPAAFAATAGLKAEILDAQYRDGLAVDAGAGDRRPKWARADVNGAK